jgi:hypothetical protein
MSSSTLNAPDSSVRPFNPWLVVGPIVVGLVAYYSFLVRHYELDDALIYFRYIRNVLAGHGLVYNVGERFNALTSPLHTYLSIAVCGLAGSIRYPMIVLSAVLTAAVALGLFAVYWPSEPRWPAVALGSALIAAMRYSYSVYGMETPLFLLLLVACLWLYERRRIFLLGIAAALLILTRGEGALLIAVLCAIHLVRRRPLPPLRDFIAPVVLLAGNAAFDLIYYGSPFPHTLIAKIQQGRSGLWGGRWLFLDVASQIEFFAGSRVLFVGSLALAILGAVRLGRRDLNVAVLGFLAALTLFYLALNVPNYHWYYAPYYAFGSMYVGLGLAELYDLAAKLRVPMLIRAGQVVAVMAGAGILGLQCFATQLRPMIDVQRQAVYPRIGVWLANNTPPEASVAMVEVGIIGYYSERRVVDILGLVSPKNAESLGAGHLDEWLQRDDPDFILVHAPLWPHEEGVVGALQAGRYRVSDAFDFPGFALLARTGRP